MENQLIYQIVVKGSDALQNLEKEQAKLLAQKERLKELKSESGIDTTAYKLAQQEIFGTKQRVAELSNEVRQQGKAFKESQYASGSYNAINAELNKLRATYKSLGNVETETGKNMLANIGRLDTKLKDIDKSMGQYGRNVGNYKEAFFNAFSQISPNFGNLVQSFQGGGVAMAGGIGLAVTAVTTLLAGLKETITINAKFSDLKLDAGIATGKTKAQVDELVESLKGIQTRTALEELLAFAEIGGKQGVTKNLDAFVLSVDKIKVALGKELGSDAETTVTELTKIVNIFFKDKIDVTNGEAIGKQLEFMGNGIKYLANQGVASGESVIRFTKELSGLKSLLGDRLTLGEVIGLGAAFEEQGVSIEVASTAMAQVIGKMGQDIPKFARLAGVSAKEFAEIYEKKPVEAMILFAENIKNSNVKLEDMITQMGIAGFEGQKVTQTFGALSGKSEEFRKKIEQGTKGLENNTLTTQGYIDKNETLQGVMDRTGNSIKNRFVNSGLESFLKGAIKLVGGLTGAFFDLGDMISNGFKRPIKNIIEQSDVDNLVKSAKTLNPLGVKSDSVGVLLPKKEAPIKPKQKSEDEIKEAERAAEKRKAAAERLNKETEDLTEKQKRRIDDIIKDTQRLNSVEIANIFDKKIQDSINKADSETTQLEQRIRELREKGKAQGFKVTGSAINGDVSVQGGNAQDKKEAALINAETQAIKAALERQRIDIEAERQKAFEKQRQKIDEYANELRGVQLQVAKEDIQLQKQNIKNGYDERITAIRSGVEDEKTLLIEQLNSNEITQLEYNTRLKEIEIESRKRILDIQKDRRNDVVNINAQILEQERLFEQEKVRLKTVSINQKLKEDELKINEDLKNGRIESEKDANDEIKALREKANFDIERVQKDSSDNLEKLNENIKKDAIQAARDEKDAKKELNNEEYEQTKEISEKKKKDAKELRDELLNLAETATSGLLKLEETRIETEKTSKISAVDSEYKKKIDAAKGNATEQERLTKELEVKKAAIEKQAAEQRKQIAIKEAIIGGLLAGIKAAPNPFAIAKVAAATLISIATIKKQKFERGTVMRLGDGTQMATIGGRKHTEGGTKIYTEFGQLLGEAEKGENIAIVNAKNSARMAELSRINSYGGNGDAFFERGGTIPSYFLNSALSQAGQSVNINNSIMLDKRSVNILSTEIANKTGEKTYTGVKRGVIDSSNNANRRNRTLANATF